MIWIHGLGEQSASFDAIARHRQLAGYSHVLVDLPGYGRAPWPAACASLEHTADMLARWIDERPSDDQNLPVLIGHSQGGVLATLVAERTAVRAVVNIDGNLTIGDCTFSLTAKRYTAEQFAAHGFAAMRDDVYRDGLVARALRGYHAAMCLASPEVFHRNASDLVAASERGDLASRFVALRCPKLFIAGSPHGICERSRALLTELRANWVAIEPSGHWPFVDQPDAFASEVAEFLRGM
ncbi:MAG: alpha/beta fold hydrolase [Deltaproteobacteria bacterium]|nr:alpha/beta fold hydrolase [Deltaproteobacteria bacterium]